MTNVHYLSKYVKHLNCSNRFSYEYNTSFHLKIAFQCYEYLLPIIRITLTE